MTQPLKRKTRIILIIAIPAIVVLPRYFRRIIVVIAFVLFQKKTAYNMPHKWGNKECMSLVPHLVLGPTT